METREEGRAPMKQILNLNEAGKRNWAGKTMLARAVAGESDCAFMEKSATSFVTMWQGSGPQNVRDLFSRARRYAPAIVFVDEIDAIGKTRTGGTNARAEEETLNALLTEMDGFGTGGSDSAPVIVLAATNLVEHLDEALKRRFDRTIEVDKPDREARLTYLTKAMAARPIKNSGFERKNAPCSRGPQELLLVHSWVPLDLKDPVQTTACEHFALK
jgi:ATP-dependent Zn protease